MTEERITVSRPAGLPFVQVATDIMRDGSLSPAARCLYAVLASFANISSRDTTLNRSTLAEAFGRGETAVDRAMNELIAGGIVTRVLRSRITAKGTRVNTASSYILHDADRFNGPSRGRDAENAVPPETGGPIDDVSALDRYVSTRNQGEGHPEIGGRSPRNQGEVPPKSGGKERESLERESREREPENEKEPPAADGDVATAELGALFAVDDLGPKLADKAQAASRADEFFAVYPRATDPVPSRIAYERHVVKAGVDQQMVIDAAIAYRDDPNRSAGYTKIAKNWLREKSWTNATLPKQASPHQSRVAQSDQDGWLSGRKSFSPPQRKRRAS